MEKKYGIDNILPALLFAAEVGNIIDAGGRVKGMARYMLITGLLDEVAAMGSVDFEVMKKEIAELDAGEREELQNKLKAKLDLVDDDLEAYIEDGIAIVEDAYSLIKRSIELVNKVKGDDAKA